MKKITYCGPFDAVDSEGLLFVKGEAVEVSDTLADSLLSQDVFSIVEPAPKEKAK